MKAATLVGQKFAHLLVLGEAKTFKKTTYCCRCDCGNLTLVARNSLMTKNTRSCGCLRIGAQRFGKILTYEYLHREYIINRRSLHNIADMLGCTEKTVQYHIRKNGISFWPAVSRIVDVTGQRFGRLTALAIAENRQGKIYWACDCDCGNYTVVRASNLRRGTTRSCGCLQAPYPNLG